MTTKKVNVYNYTGQTLSLILTDSLGNTGGSSPPMHISNILPSTTTSTSSSYSSNYTYDIYDFLGKTLVGQTTNSGLLISSGNSSMDTTDVTITVGIMTTQGIGSFVDANGNVVTQLPPSDGAVFLTQYPSWFVTALKTSATTLNTTIASFTSLLKKVIIFIMVIVVILVVVFGVVLYKKYKSA